MYHIQYQGSHFIFSIHSNLPRDIGKSECEVREGELLDQPPRSTCDDLLNEAPVLLLCWSQRSNEVSCAKGFTWSARVYCDERGQRKGTYRFVKLFVFCDCREKLGDSPWVDLLKIEVGRVLILAYKNSVGKLGWWKGLFNFLYQYSNSRRRRNMHIRTFPYRISCTKLNFFNPSSCKALGVCEGAVATISKNSSASVHLLRAPKATPPA